MILLDVISTGYGNLDSANHAGLVAVASQCPYTGGQAVYLARALLSEFDTLYYDDDDCENLDFSPRLQDKTTNGKSSFKVYPNPANDELTILTNSEMKDFELKIFDGQGNMIISKNVKATTEIKININALKNGLYFYTIRSFHVILQKGKFGVLH